VKRVIATLIFFLVLGSTISQTCEKYNRKLFHSLPDNLPDSINCKDKLGRKQGWWIYYKVFYNPVDKPDELEKGDYVPDYIYGQYKDDIKIKDWHTVNNVHQIYDQREDEYHYSKDTTLIKSWFAQGGFNESVILYLKDSTIIKSTSLCADEKHPICIECDKKKETCTMTYRNKFIKVFPFENFASEFERTFFSYGFDKKLIDNDLK
jgi:hypothetical protein